MKLRQLIDGIDGIICTNPLTLEKYYEHCINLITQSPRYLSEINEFSGHGIIFVVPTIDGKTASEKILDQSIINVLTSISLSAVVVNDCQLVNLLASVTYPVFKVTQIKTINEIFGELCNRYYNYPSRFIHHMIGVTGTNGKTTVTHMIEKCLSDANLTVGLIGTLGYRYHNHENSMDEYIPTGYTTPNAWIIQTILNDMTNKYHIENVIMEVSSHGLAFDRIYGSNCDIGVFTNFTQDHLGFHKTMENYLQSKLLLFSKYLSKSSSPKAIINHDDPSYEQFINVCPSSTEIYTYGLSKKNENSFVAYDIKNSSNGVNYTILIPSGETRRVHLNAFGVFNVYNSLACIAACLTTYSHLLTLDNIIQSLETFQSVKGRFEFIIRHKPFSVVVDYAHTPDGLEQVLKTGRQLLSESDENGLLIVVFGCNGRGDRTKRPILGHIAEQHADITIVTSESPYQEDPQTIIDGILSGIEDKTNRNRIYVELDRKKAIHLAMNLANGRNDLIIIAGKGHEITLTHGDRDIPFNEKEIIENKYKEMMDNNTSFI